MKSNKILKKQKRRLLVYNLIAFFIIFIVLGLVAVISIEGYFYNDADRELNFSRDQLTAQLANPYISSGIIPYPEYRKNPRMNYILYDEDKNIIPNLSSIPNLDSVSLPVPGPYDQIYNIKLDGYNFRVLEFSLSNNDTVFFAQLLINIDGEIALRNNIISIYFICLSAIIVLTVAVSYLMSALTMQPIKKSMDEQTRFVSDASHELRTPLTVLHGRLEQLLNYPDEKIIDKSDIISDSLSEVIRLTKLSGDLLTLAKSDSDKFVPDKSEFDIFELAKITAMPYIDMAACDYKEFVVCGESVTVTADYNKIRQVLIALFDNALKYTAGGDKITVDLYRQKNKCEITVSDTGIGISEKGLSRIFDRFYRDDTSRNVTEGSGLGLSIVKQIVEEHKGSITVANNTPKGAKFIVLLPLS